MTGLLEQDGVEVEIDKIIQFLRSEIKDQKCVVGVSGGLDSDVVARLVFEAVGVKENLKLFTVIQEGMEARHLEHARNLARDLTLPLRELDLQKIPELFIEQMAQGDTSENFLSQGLLDPSRAKVSLRTMVLSSYQDRGYIVAGTSNKTEIDLGFFLPFGDGVWHLGPLAHLYKSEVRLIAKQLGSSQAVLDQPASAGFWEGQEDLEDMSYWLVNEGPIGQERDFSDEEGSLAKQIYESLSTGKLDIALNSIGCGERKEAVQEKSGLPKFILKRLYKHLSKVSILKHRKLGVQLARC